MSNARVSLFSGRNRSHRRHALDGANDGNIRVGFTFDNAGSGTIAVAAGRGSITTPTGGLVTSFNVAAGRSIVLESAENGRLMITGGTVLSSNPGAWTPAMSASGGGVTFSSVTASGNYWQSGNLVTVEFSYAGTPTYTSGSGYWQITGLPINPANGNGVANLRNSGGITYGTGKTMFFGIAQGSAIRLRVQGSASAESDLAIAGIPSGGAITIKGSFTYTV